jgi:lipopolysaccharide biosynthesis protein
LNVSDYNLDTFVPIIDSKTIEKFNTKLLAFYLPQFYPVDLNNKYHGQGFTEWVNVTKAQPLFTGHYQPHLPIDVGFYDLSHTDVMFRQIELAKMYGIYGFCTYYYWFSGKKLLNKPFENYLNDKKLNFPFCFCWELHNRTKSWDSSENELIMKQTLNDDDYIMLFNDLLPYFQDERYIRINNKPVFVVFLREQFPKEKIKLFFDNLNNIAKSHFDNGLYFVCARTNAMFINGMSEEDPCSFGFDAYCDFPPHNLIHNEYMKIKPKQGYIKENSSFWINDLEEFIKSNRYENIGSSYKLFQSCFPSWDNTPRNARKKGIVFSGITPALYKQWLKYLISWTKQNHTKDEQFIFINAWNEWAEGAHLEPDRKYGYAYLQATRDALEEDL